MTTLGLLLVRNTFIRKFVNIPYDTQTKIRWCTFDVETILFFIKFSLQSAYTDHCMMIQFQRTKNFFMSKAQIKIQRYCCNYVHFQTTTRDKYIIWRPPYNFIWRPPYNFMWRPPYKFIWRPPYKCMWRPPNNFMWRPPYKQFMWRPPYKFMWRPPYKFIWRPPYNLLKWRPPYKFMWRPPYKLYGGRHLKTLYGGRQIKLYGGRHIICASNYYLMWHQSASVLNRSQKVC